MHPILKLISITSLLFLFSNVALATDFDIVRSDKDSWVCVDYTIDYCRDNPEFIPCSISYNPLFKGVSHMVAVKILDDETILIHDEMYNAEFEVHNWFDDGQYYHFWIDEPIKRNYRFLKDNREMVLY